MTRLLAVNGSYREHGAIDQALDVAVQSVSAAGAIIEVIHLRDFPIEFCRNCRHCTQVPGEAPGECVHQDGMRELIAKIEAADGYILASPDELLLGNRTIQEVHGEAGGICLLAMGITCPEIQKKESR